MVGVVNCHAGVLGSNPGGPKDFFFWNYFIMFMLSHPKHVTSIGHLISEKMCLQSNKSYLG